jgi:ATP-dependent RNA helicase DHX8/PRP22
MDDLYNLELLSLVAKITQEIDNHTGVNDKTLAEFVINLHEQSKTLPEFKKKLDDVGASFPDSFIENMDRLILNMHPIHKKKPATSAANANSLTEEDKKKRLFPGLSKPDQDWQPSSMSKGAVMKEVDDLMSQLEGMAGNGRSRPLNSESERSAKRQRRDAPRSPSPRRRGRSPSPRRDRSSSNRRPPLDSRPVQFKIYDGKVAGLKDFGAFVQLEGVVGRVEGESRRSTRL